MAIAVGTLDPDVYSKYKSFGDIQTAQANNNLLQQAANIDLQNKAQLYQTQLFSTAAASGDPAAIQAAKAHAAAIVPGFDPSQWSDDPTKLAAQAAVARQFALNPYQAATIGQAAIASDINAIKTGGPAAAYIQRPGGVGQSAATVANLPVQAAPLIAADATPTSIAPPPVQSGPLTQPMDQGSIQIPQKPVQVATIDDPSQSALNISQTPTQGPTIGQAAAQVANTPIQPAQVSQFNYPPNDGTKTNEQYNADRAAAQKEFEMSPAYIQAKSAAESTGKGIGDTTVKAATSSALTSRIQQGLNAMDQINEGPDMPHSGALLSPDAQTAISNRLGNSIVGRQLGITQAPSDATQAFTKINKQQVIVGLQDMLAAAPAGSRLNRQIVNLVDMANGIDTNASQKSIRDQIGILRNELSNIPISELNSLQDLKGGTQQPYNAIPITTPAPNQASGQAPEGTVVSNGKQNLIKKNGQWVIQ